MAFNHPFAIVATSASTYTLLYTSTHYLSLPTPDPQTNLKTLSSAHATLTTGLALYALSKPWNVDEILPALNLGLGKSRFDDSFNPMIAGRSGLGNAVTALETGYLLFDILALVYVSLRSLPRDQRRPLVAAVSRLAKKEPLMLFHHLSLLTGLGTLQYFIARGRERGMYIIVSFLLMNASTPLLHLRWWRRKRTGRSSLPLDVALAVVFGACRLGVVCWVLREYGKWHGVSAWEALRGQRWVCQVGTGMLVGLNGIWLGVLGRSIVRRVWALLLAKKGA